MGPRTTWGLGQGKSPQSKRGKYRAHHGQAICNLTLVAHFSVENSWCSSTCIDSPMENDTEQREKYSRKAKNRVEGCSGCLVDPYEVVLALTTAMMGLPLDDAAKDIDTWQ